ncbi:GDSL-type esterase/lipase family protein [Novosphingobium sediminis]|uniref:GDSL-type esterase/lipase family protein n=1 Tax=Novosphingobium sediminis TaxID=707214 RepID=UPI001478D0BC|nr:GDSL-type esterase/lipase family protein [Novosphingobium sediminis]
MQGRLKSRLGKIGLAFLMASAAPAIAQDAHRFVAETPTAREDYWQKRAAEIEHQLAGPQSLAPIRLVFVGDSITDFWHLDANPWFPGKYCGQAIWAESFGGKVPALTGLNLGVSGDRIEHVLHRLQPKSEGGEGWLDRPDLQPDTVVLLLGINNSFDSESPATESIYKGVLAVIARLQERKPNARIVLQSLLPTDDPAKNRELVTVVNRQLAAYAAQAKGIRYLDLYSAFVDAEGNQRKDLFNDGLHPSRSGYAVWRDRLVPVLTAPR